MNTAEEVVSSSADTLDVPVAVADAYQVGLFLLDLPFMFPVSCLQVELNVDVADRQIRIGWLKDAMRLSMDTREGACESFHESAPELPMVSLVDASLLQRYEQSIRSCRIVCFAAIAVASILYVIVIVTFCCLLVMFQ